jgi:hypothetical protein
MAGAVFLVAALGLEKQALSEQGHGHLGLPKQNTRDRAWGKCIDNHHYRYRATPCRGETKKDRGCSKTPGQDPGIQSDDIFKGTVKLVPASFLSSLGEVEMRRHKRTRDSSILTDALWPQYWFLKLLSDFSHA